MERRLGSSLFAGLTALGLACVLWPAALLAGEALDFKPVPRESISRFERVKIVRHTPAPDPTDTMSFDGSSVDEPDAPEPPSPAPPMMGRSRGIMKIGQDIHVGPQEVIHGDLSSWNGSITIEGHVEGDVVAMRGDVKLKSTARVDGDVVCLGGQLSEEPGAQVSGQKVTAGHSGSWSIRDSGEDSEDSGSSPVRHHRDHVAAALVWLLMIVLFGWLLVRIAPGPTAAAVAMFHRSPGLSLGVGSLIWALIIPSLIALVLVVALLCITIIGIPLALAALVGYSFFLAVLAVWGLVVAATILGGGLSSSSQGGILSGVPSSAHPAGVAGMPVAGVGGGANMPQGPSLMRHMLIGVGVLMGSIVVGNLLRATGFGPLHGLGTLVLVLGIIGTVIATTFGAGALLRSEIARGSFKVIWRVGRFRGAAAPAGGAPPPPSDPMSPTAAAAAPWPPMTPSPPVQPSPPEAFQPPVVPGAGSAPASSEPPQDQPPPIG